MKKIFIAIISFCSILSYNAHAQTTKGTIVNMGGNTVEVFGDPSVNLTNVIFGGVSLTISFTDQGALNPAGASIVVNSLIPNLTTAVIVNTNPGDSFVLAGRVYYTFLLGTPGIATISWTANASNPIATFHFTFDPSTVPLAMQLNDQSFGGQGLGGGGATNPSGQSFWYVQLNQAPGDITNYATMFYGTGAVNTAAATPSFVPLQVSDPLPVKFISFTATEQGTDASLEWTVANEGSISKDYEVQKSTDNGITYVTIDTVLITNPIATSNSYSFTDPTLLTVKAASNTIYYRIKQVDNNGLFAYSSIEIIHLTNTNADPALTVYPNPVRDYATVQFDLNTDATVTVSVTNLNGQVMMSTQWQGVQGENKPTINLSSFVSGNYLLKLNIGGDTHTASLIKE